MKAASIWPDWLDDIWAKSPSKEETTGESLAQHTWEVLERVVDLARLRPDLPDEVERPNLWNLLFWAALLHDWGKAARGFQRLLRGDLDRWGHRHEVLSVAFVGWIADGWTEDDVDFLSATILSHHKDAPEIELAYPVDLDEGSAIEELVGNLDRDTVGKLWHWLVEVVPAWISDLGVADLGVEMPNVPEESEAVEGILAHGDEIVAERVSRYLDLVEDLKWDSEIPRRLMGILLRGYLVQADHTASAHAGRFSPAPVSRNSVLEGAGLAGLRLYEHQQRAGETVGSAVLVAPTGSGKTEAALLWAARQARSKGRLPRLFYTLPYQASMNAMYDRLRPMFRGKIGLLHGRSALALYRRLMEEESYDPRKAEQRAKWMRNLAQLHLTPVEVFSPYQMLKFVYQLKGYEAMIADYADAAFIFDEIHAYEPQRLAMILEMIRYLRDHLNAVFFVMSATLPSVVRRKLEDVLGRAVSIRASYDLFERYTRHVVRIVPGDLLSDRGVGRVVNAFSEGRSALVVLNTVARAQEMYRILSEAMPDAAGQVVMVHGRFNGRDRLRKEHRILESAGLGRSGGEPVIVVATQVVEVSLNIDLDTLFSDPAPLDALVQRFGRVNRKGRLGLAPVHVFTEPSDGQGIYDDRMVKGALEVLIRHANGRPIHEGQVGKWLDEVFGKDGLLSDWDREFDRAAEEFRDICEELSPFESDPGLEEAFDRLFDSVEVLPKSLEYEFLSVSRSRPLEASELFVPISWGRWHQLRQARLLLTEEGEWPQVVEVPYSEELGLDFSKI